MNTETKIGLINAYKQVISTNLKLNKVPEEISKVVQDEFQTFVNNRIEDLLGNVDSKSVAANPSSRLSSEDVDVLLALVENVRSKQRSNVEGPVRPPQQQRAKQAAPPRPVDNDPEGDKYRSDQFKLLKALEKMERAGPEY